MGAFDSQRFATIRRIRPDGVVLLVGTTIQFRVAVLNPGVILLTGGGSRSASPEDAQAELAMLKELDSELQRASSLTVFADLREMPRMSAQSRDVATTWMRDNRPKIKASHVLVRSKLVEMAMSIVGMVVGGGILKLYSRPDVFLGLIRASAPQLTALPTLSALE
jgi:hypothetical protein